MVNNNNVGDCDECVEEGGIENSPSSSASRIADDRNVYPRVSNGKQKGR